MLHSHHTCYSKWTCLYPITSHNLSYQRTDQHYKPHASTTYAQKCTLIFMKLEHSLVLDTKDFPCILWCMYIIYSQLPQLCICHLLWC